MANLGKLIGTSPQHLIVRTQAWDATQSIPEIGDAVFTAEKEKIGLIFDIFGPVKKPFISVKLNKSYPKTLEQFNDEKGLSLYTFQASKSRKNMRHHKHKSTRSSSSKTSKAGNSSRSRSSDRKRSST